MKRFFMMTGILLFTACASAPPSDVEIERGVTHMTASWYGQKFHGRQTASGERYDMHGMTAAHKTLKFGTRLQVTNPDTGLSAVVKVNDRGPFIRGRDLDLSYGAARKIGLVQKGVGRVRVEHLGRDMRYSKRVPYVVPDEPGAFTVQVGSFSDKERAFRLKQGLANNYSDVYVAAVVLDGKRYYRVKVGNYSDYDRAYAAAQRLADEGYDTIVMKRNR